MSHKEKQGGFFRRIRSPLEHRTTSKHEDKARSSSTSVIPMQHSNGHQRTGSDDVLKIENLSYGEPDILNSTSSSRSHSTGTSPGDIINPPLPPRNYPKQLQQSNMNKTNVNDESLVYVAPADTLQRSSGASSGTNNISQAVLSNYTRAEPLSAPPSRSERKVMEMHQLTMCQKQRQDMGQSGPSQQQRVPTVVDNSEYSTPFNLLQQQRMANKGGMKSATGQGRPRRVPQIGIEANDEIMPVLSPPPGHSDRSQTTSPSSPSSTPSSEHEEVGPGGNAGVGGSGGGGDSDYDIPWDRKFKDLQFVNRAPKRQPSSGKVLYQEDHKEPHPGLRARRDSPPLRYPRGYTERSSPPAPPERNPTSYQSRGRKSPPHPPEELHLTRPPVPRYLPARHQSEQHRPRDGSTSPSQLVGRYGGHTIHGPHIQRDLPPEISPRTSSMSGSYMSGRRLPSPPRDRSESSPVVERRGVLRPPSPPNPVHIDFSIPLCDQPWYHGDIKRRDAEQVLIDHPDFSFLVRDSESCKTDYSLSIRDSANGFIHLRMVQETDSNNQLGYVLGQFSSHFTTVAECIAFYTKQRLNIRGAEHKKLRYPVPRASDTMASFRV